MKVLIILAHPTYETSVANKTIVEDLVNTLGSTVEVRHLDTLYPNYKIDVDAEQNALLKADVVVFQHPFYWYNVPPILKLWMDQVLTYGFAYGNAGDKLKGKHFIQSFTTGGPKEAYTVGGYNNYPIEQFITPIVQTARLIQMIYHDPIYTNGFNPLHNENAIAAAKNHAKRLIDAIRSI